MRRLSTDEAWGAGADLWDLMYGEEDDAETAERTNP